MEVPPLELPEDSQPQTDAEMVREERLEEEERGAERTARIAALKRELEAMRRTLITAMDNLHWQIQQLEQD